MELIKKNIHMNKLKCKSTLQLNLNDDINVPDTRPDIAAIMKISGETTWEEQKILSGKLYLKGSLSFCLLYLSAEEDCRIHTLSGKLPIDETIHLEAECSTENTTLRSVLEDLSANLINSRKVSIKSLLSLTVTAEEIYDEPACTAIENDVPLCTRMVPLQLTGLAACKKDSYRLRDEITLPSSKSSIRELLYRSISLKNVDIRLLKDQFTIKGDAVVFLLYAAEDGEAAAEYYESELPFHATIDCNGCSETMTPDINLVITDKTFEIKQDSDGEPRIVSLDLLIEIQIKIYEDATFNVIQDVYSPFANLTPIYRPVVYENLLVHNANKVRINDRVKISDTAPKILQICHGSGTIHIDNTYPSEDGLMTEGSIEADIFYITPEDSRPMYAMKASVPFQQLIEVHDLNPDTVYTITPELEQLTVLSNDSDELEIKASVLLNSLVFNRITAQFLTDVTEEPLDYEALMDLPGMTGYIVKENDDLWSIAKAHHTTSESILALNDLTEENLAVGTHLLLLKEVLV